MKKILILGVSAVQMDAVIELKKMKNVIVYTCAQKDDGPASKYSDHFELLNFMEVEKLKEYVIKEKFDAIYSVGSDIAMPVVAKISEELKLPCFISENSAKICNNKNKLREFLGNDFEGNIRFQVLKSVTDSIDLKYPFIMKPSDSQGQRGVKVVKSYEEFLQQFDRTMEYSRAKLVIIEEYLDGPEFSVNAYLLNGKIEFLILSDRLIWDMYDGGLIHKHIVPSQYSTPEYLKKIEKLVQTVAEKIKVENGPLYFQIKNKNNCPKIIEVTPRLDGCHMWNVLKEYTKVNLLKLTFEHLLLNKKEELNKFKIDKNCNYTLEFLCEKPNAEANYKQYELPKNILSSFNYYNDGDIIRAINGKYEKIGYFIIRNNK